MEKNKVCINKVVVYLFLFTGLILGLLFITKKANEKPVSYKSEAAEAINPTPTSICNKYGEFLLTTTDGKCYSVGSVSFFYPTLTPNMLTKFPSMPGREDLYEVCYSEPVKAEDRNRCPPPTYWNGPGNFTEVYEGGEYKRVEDYRKGEYIPIPSDQIKIEDKSVIFGKKCRSHGIETELNPNTTIVTNQYQSIIRQSYLHEPQSSFLISYRNVDFSKKCKFSPSCEQNRFAIIGDKCWHLAFKPCEKQNGALVFPACCSSPVDMKYCPITPTTPTKTFPRRPTPIEN